MLYEVITLVEIERHPRIAIVDLTFDDHGVHDRVDLGAAIIVFFHFGVVRKQPKPCEMIILLNMPGGPSTKAARFHRTLASTWSLPGQFYWRSLQLENLSLVKMHLV